MKNLAHILKSESPLEPLEFDDHQLIVSLGTKFYNSVRVRGASPMALLAIETYITKAAAKMKPPAPPEPPPGMGPPPGMAPPGMEPPPMGPPPMGPEMGPPPGPEMMPQMPPGPPMSGQV